MKVVSDMRHDLVGGVPYNLNLEEFSQDDGKSVLFYGLGSTTNHSLQKEYDSYKRKVLLNLWSPCEWMAPNLEGRTPFQQIHYFDEVYCICPYTIKWLRDNFQDTKHKYIFHPYDDRSLQNYKIPEKKPVDVCWFGGFHGEEHYRMGEVFQKFNNIVLSKGNNKYVTHHNVPHNEKLHYVSQSKISIIYNSLCLQQQNVAEVMRQPLWRENRAYSRLSGERRVPQYKCRMGESARSKCVMLVIEDYWNVCENFWIPNVDFFYTSLNTMEKDIRTILEDYEKDYVQKVIQSAYSKSLKHTPEETYEFIKRGDECIF